MPTLEAVKAAITTLQREGGTVSIEAVRAITGGSPRDIGPLLKQIRVETAPRPAPVGYVLTYPEPPASSRLSFQEVYQAVQALRRAWRQSLWTQSTAEPTPALVVGYFDAQHQYRPPILPWEVWSALRPAVTDPSELRLLDCYVEALRRGQALWSDTRERHQLAALWARLLVDPTV